MASRAWRIVPRVGDVWSSSHAKSGLVACTSMVVPRETKGFREDAQGFPAQPRTWGKNRWNVVKRAGGAWNHQRPRGITLQEPTRSPRNPGACWVAQEPRIRVQHLDRRRGNCYG